MTNKKSESPFGDANYVQQPQTNKNPALKYILIGVGLLVLLGMGSCVWGFGSLFAMASERQSATDEFVDAILEKGLPAMESELWSKDAGISAEGYFEVEQMVAHFAPGERASESTCNANVSARTNGPSGTFVMCVTQTTYAATTGRIELTWKKESEDWKVYQFYTHYDDASSYDEAKARAKSEAEMAVETSDD